MKIMYKVFSILLTVIIITNTFVIMSITSVAAQTSEGFEYRILSNGTAEITKYRGSDTNLNIPSTLNGYSVKSIGNNAFDGNSNLVTVSIPDSITSIGDYAFRACTSLVSYDIPNSVTSFGKNVFEYCTKLKTAIIPNKLTVINSPFNDCHKLTKVTIPNSIKTIGYWAFASCVSLEYVSIPGSVTSIGYNGFCNCLALKSIIIPGSVTSIYSNAFDSCPLLTIYCPAGSYAENFAKNHSIPYKNISGAALNDHSDEDKFNYISKNYPQYLNNNVYNKYQNAALRICNDALQHNDNSSANILRAFAEGFVNGDKILIKELFSSLGVGQSTQEEWLEENTLDFISEISSSENYISSKYDKISKKYKDFKTTVKAIDLADTVSYAAKKAEFIKELSDKSSVLDKEQVEELADKLFKKKENIEFFDLADYVVDAADILSLSLQMLDVEESVLQDVMNNIDTDSLLYKGLSENLVRMRSDPVNWVITKYFDNMVLDKMVDFLGDIKNGFLSLTNGGLEKSLTLKVVSTISSILYKYVWKYSKIDDINGAIQAYDFLTTIRIAKTNKLNQIFNCYNNGTVPSDELINDYSDMFCVEESAMKHFANTCKKLEEKSSDHLYLSSIESICDDLDNIYSFENYITCCLNALKNDIYNGSVSCNHGLNYKTLEVSPTCTDSGYDTMVCELCGHTWNIDNSPALGHTYSNTVISPTCNAQGYTRHRCTRCSNSYNDTYVPALGHNYSDTVVSPTCTEQGYTTHRCSRCLYTFTDSYVNAKGHRAGDTLVVDLPSSDNDGFSRTICADCGRVIKIDLIPYLSISDAVISEDAPYTLKYMLPKATAQTGYTDYSITISSAAVEKTVSDYYVDGDNLVFVFDNLTKDDIKGKISAVLKANLYDTNFTSNAFVSEFISEESIPQPDTVEKQIVNGVYYENGVAKNVGLVKVGSDYYYTTSGGKIVYGDQIIYSSRTNGLLPGGVTYHFDETTGKLYKDNVIIDDVYYKEGKASNVGIVKVAGSYYVTTTKGVIVKNAENKYIASSRTNGLVAIGYYDFGADGKMILKNGIIGGKYYKDGKATNVGLFEYEIDGVTSIYCTTTGGVIIKDVTNKFIASSRTNGLAKAGYYSFDSEGRMIK